MQSIVGIDGLKPTLDLIKLSKKIAIVNKESLVCGWNLINKELKLHNTKFIPIDSEHFSIHNLIENIDIKEIKKIYITASGGPFLKYKNIKKYKINLPQALSHPNWKMGKKISIDSATMMNKVFEVIEAKNIFNIPYNKINIITHPKSYIHSIVELNNGLIKFLAHNPDMKIPIINSIYENKKTILSNVINFKILNNLNFRKINHTQFPFVKILNKLPSYNSLYETAIITTNDFYVNLFLNKKIDYLSMLASIKKILNHKNLIKYKKIRVKNVSQVVNFREELSSKLQNLVYKN
jgi:1-deoxy-D-xylulose-5-phosphate reductoisomerase